MQHDDDTRSTRRPQLADMRRAGYHGPAYLRGRPAHEYLPRYGRRR